MANPYMPFTDEERVEHMSLAERLSRGNSSQKIGAVLLENVVGPQANDPRLFIGAVEMLGAQEPQEMNAYGLMAFYKDNGLALLEAVAKLKRLAPHSGTHPDASLAQAPVDQETSDPDIKAGEEVSARLPESTQARPVNPVAAEEIPPMPESWNDPTTTLAISAGEAGFSVKTTQGTYTSLEDAIRHSTDKRKR